VQTDATGLAEVDYSDDSYTRLDVGTTLKIEKLSDDQGNRQVETSVDVGRTWNRTAALTESQSFEQTGAGATAAIVGTAFALLCDSPVHCDFIGIEHTFQLTSTNGEVRVLSPLDKCTSADSNLCDEVTQLTPEELLAIQWIVRNIALDMALGYQFPFLNGTVQVANGQVSFTPTPTTATPPTDGTTPGPAPSIDQTNPVQAGPPGGPYVGANNITVEDETKDTRLTINAINAAWLYFTLLTNLNGNGTNVGTLCAPGGTVGVDFCGDASGASGYVPVVLNTPYASTTQFSFYAQENESTAPATGSFTVVASNDAAQPAPPSDQTTVDVAVTEDPCESGCG
jgi:hypothetical protein